MNSLRVARTGRKQIQDQQMNASVQEFDRLAYKGMRRPCWLDLLPGLTISIMATTR